MLYDNEGRQLRIGQTVEDFIWNVGGDIMLPSWLVAVGTSILTFTGPSASPGIVTAQTKLATPAVDDAAGIQTAFSIATPQFSEISFSVTGMTADAGASATNHSLQMKLTNGSTTGAQFTTDNAAAGASKQRIFPGAETGNAYAIADALNVPKRKSLGMVIRPKTREVFYTTGDPDDGAGVVGYSRNAFVDVTGPFVMQILTKAAAQRSLSLARVHLRLSSF
jgi:hypothetical protein